jgi:hypothetical protein
MEGLAAAVLLIAILLGLLLVIGGLVFPARATPAEAIGISAQEAKESVDWGWRVHPRPAHHRPMGGD